jgi:glycosyltransferase involved in cell wall biosynthesis
MVSSETLGREDVEFLIGSVYVDCLLRRRRLREAWRAIRSLINALRSGDVLTIDDVPSSVSLQQGAVGVRDLVSSFRQDRKRWGGRRAVGAAVLARRILLFGLITAGLTIARREVRMLLGLRAGTSTGPGMQKRKRPSQQAATVLEAWDDLFVKSTRRGHTADSEGRGSSLYLPRRLADEVGRDWLRNWLDTFGFDNSGIRIERYAGAIVPTVAAETVDRMRLLAEAGDEAAAVDVLVESDVGARLSTTCRLQLRRLGSVMRCASEGFPLPTTAAPSYEPVPGRVFYLIHMREPYELNGYVVRTQFILKALSKAGFIPEPVTRLGFPNDLARHRGAAMIAEEQVDDHVFRSLPDIGGGQLGRPVHEYVNAYAERIVELARQRRPAAIHAASNYLNGLAAITAARRLGIPCVYEVRGLWEITQASANSDYAHSLRYRLQRSLENEVVRHADGVITISEPLRRFVIEQGATAAKVSVVPNGVDADHMRPVPCDVALKAELKIPVNSVVIGYVGSVVRYEGLDFVLESLARLRDLGLSGFHFLVVGDGRELPALKEQAQLLGMDNFCSFLGRVPHERVEALYSIIDIAPLPRRSLPVTELVPPLKPYEAMAGGKAVIVSNVAALAGTVIDEETGLIVEKNNVAALTRAMQRLIVDPELRRRLGQRSREWVVEERSLPALARHLRDAYLGLGVAVPERVASTT